MGRIGGTESVLPFLPFLPVLPLSPYSCAVVAG